MLNEELAGHFGDHDYAVDPGHGCQKDPIGLAVGRFLTELRTVGAVDEAMFGAVASVHNDRSARDDAGQDAVVMDKVIVCMENVGPVTAQLLGYLPDGSQAWSGAFGEGADRDAHGLCLWTEFAGLG